MSCGITEEQLVLIYGIQPKVAKDWIEYINKALEYAECNTVKRKAAFLAQIGHESGRLRYVREIWGPTTQQLRYEGTDLAKRLGNTQVGDGFRYRGRGLIQITGRYNYKMTYQELLKDFPDVPNFEEQPEKLEEKYWAAISAALYWNKHKLNKFSDEGNFVGQTVRINGGTNGLQERQELYIRGLAVLE